MNDENKNKEVLTPGNNIVSSAEKNMVEENNVKPSHNEEVIDLGAVIKKLWKGRKLYYIVLPIVFVLSCLHILTVPRTYSTSIELAPELEQPSMGGSLSSLASSFGFDLSDLQSSDAITPLLYPDLMDDNKFVVGMFRIKIRTSKDTLNTDYYTYLKNYSKHDWLENLQAWCKKMFGSNKHKDSIKGEKDNPYMLSKIDDDIVKAIQNDVKINVDKKTGVITISATAQDPLACKIIADSVTSRLQKFITKYRTSKAQLEADHYKKLMNESLHEYEKVRAKYGAYSDANTDLILESVKSKLEDMENDMQLKYNQYTTYNTQYQASMAKVLERTPAFTTLKGAEVPIKPAGPKRMIFVFAMTFLAFVLVSLYTFFFK